MYGPVAGIGFVDCDSYLRLNSLQSIEQPVQPGNRCLDVHEAGAQRRVLGKDEGRRVVDRVTLKNKCGLFHGEHCEPRLIPFPLLEEKRPRALGRQQPESADTQH